MRILDVKEMKIAGYSNPNRNTGGRSMQEYEAGASWTMKQLATAMEEYGEDVGSPRNKEGYVLLMYFSPISGGTLTTKEAAFIRAQQDLPGTNCDDSHAANNEP